MAKESKVFRAGIEIYRDDNEIFVLGHALLEHIWKFLISARNLRRASKVGKNKIDWKPYYNNGVR